MLYLNFNEATGKVSVTMSPETKPALREAQERNNVGELLGYQRALLYLYSCEEIIVGNDRSFNPKLSSEHLTYFTEFCAALDNILKRYDVDNIPEAFIACRPNMVKEFIYVLTHTRGTEQTRRLADFTVAMKTSVIFVPSAIRPSLKNLSVSKSDKRTLLIALSDLLRIQNQNFFVEYAEKNVKRAKLTCLLADLSKTPQGLGMEVPGFDYMMNCYYGNW